MKTQKYPEQAANPLLCELRLFGALTLRRPGQPEKQGFTTRKPGELLALIGCGHSVEMARTVLWPEERDVNNCLKQTVRVLRRDLEKVGAANVITASRSPLSLSKGVTTDVDTFEAACRLAATPAADLEAPLAAVRAAKEIHARVFLAQYESAWVREKRDAFALKLTRASAHVFELLFEAVGAAVESMELEAAEKYARACLELKENSLEPCWSLMRIYALRGRPSLIDDIYEELGRKTPARTQEEIDTYRMLVAQARKCMVSNCTGISARNLSLSEKERTAGLLYAQGRALWKERLKKPLELSEKQFREAIAVNEEYAPAYSGLADALALQAYYGIVGPQKAYEEAMQNAKRALLLAPGLAEAHTSMGWIDLVYRWNWSEAQHSFSKALELDPSYETAHQWYSFYLMLMKRTPESTFEIGVARQLNRYPAIISKSIGQRYYHECKYEEAIRTFENTLRETPGFSLTHYLLAQALEQLALQRRQEAQHAEADGEASEYLRRAVDEFQIARELSRTDGLFASSIEAGMAHAYASWGKQEEAQRIRAELLEQREEGKRYISPFALAVCCLGLGDTEQTLAWLRQGVVERPGDMVLVHIDPRFSGMKKNKELRRIITQEMGLS